MPDSVVILGAGQAGFQAAASLRQAGFAGTVTLVGDEPDPPYQRPPLSKSYILGKTTRDELAFRPGAFFAESGIELVCDTATAIDRKARTVALASGATRSYDHLVLATGARNRPLPVPGADLDGVLDLRTRTNADAIAAALSETARVVVIGAGFIGLEFAAAVRRGHGAEVHVVELAARPMARALSAEMADVVTDAHRAWGVTFDFGTGVAALRGVGGRVRSVELTDGRELPADLVICGVGVQPNAELAADAGLKIADGVCVDEDLTTSDPTISAIGDCVVFPCRYADAPVRLESVQNAADQGRAVAARLTGTPAPYAAVPWFWSDQGDLKLQMVGLADGHDTAVMRGEPAERSCSVLLFREGRLVAVEALNRAVDYMVARKLLARDPRPALDPIEAARDDFDLRAFEAATR